MEEEERVDKFQFACADIEDGDRTGGARVGFGGGVPDAPDTPTPPPKR